MAFDNIGRARSVARSVSAYIRQTLDKRQGHKARFEFELQDHLNQTYSDSTLRAVIGWGGSVSAN